MRFLQVCWLFSTLQSCPCGNVIFYQHPQHMTLWRVFNFMLPVVTYLSNECLCLILLCQSYCKTQFFIIENLLLQSLRIRKDFLLCAYVLFFSQIQYLHTSSLLPKAYPFTRRCCAQLEFVLLLLDKCKVSL
jgi:hypothetical protein